MGLIKALFYTACGSLLVLFWREGQQTLMTLTAIAWLPALAWDLALALTPYQKNARHGND